MASSLSSSLSTTKGFHTVLTTNIQSISPSHVCTLHFILSLPPQVLVDLYELNLSRQSYHASFLNGQRSDIESPAAQANTSVVLFDVILKANDQSSTNVSVDVPLHMRYATVGSLGTSDGFLHAKVPSPMGFWACPPASSPNGRSKTSSSDPVARLKGTRDIKWIYPSTSVVGTVSIPVAQAKDTDQVQIMTSVIVLLAFIYVVFVSWGAVKRTFGIQSVRTKMD